jgi:nucleoside-diphosphate-sugar epimerase
MEGGFMNLLVTGGSGFLGYHICNKLKDKFKKIIIIDIAPIDKDEYPENVEFYNVDVRDYKGVLEKMKEADLIVHGAAALPLWSKKDIFTTNVDGTKNVLNAAKELKKERVVFISSTAVYGIPKRHPIYEDDELNGVGPYGESKIIAEKICEEERKKGMMVPVIRPKTFIGTGRMGVFYILYDWVYNGSRIPIIGDGKNRYQLLEVEDLVDSIYSALTLPESDVNWTFNVGAERFRTVYEDITDFLNFANTGSKVLRTPAPIIKFFLEIAWNLRISPLYKWVYGTADKDSFVSIERAKERLNFRPKYSNSEALIRSYKWFLEKRESLLKEKREGITHTVPWKQGIIGIFKWILK